MSDTAQIDYPALLSFAAQHLSVTWSQRTAEFASYLFLIDLFPTTLLPSALYGFFIALSAVLFGGNVASLLDHSSRLKVVRYNIFLAKTTLISLYLILLVLLVKYPHEAKQAGQTIPHRGHPVVWTLYALAVLAGCVMKLSDIAMSVAIERDWVTVIAAGSDPLLTRLNLWLRRIDLGCKLLSPLLTGLLTATVGNVRTLVVISAVALAGLGFELFWIRLVWRRFPVLDTTHRPHTSQNPNPNTNTNTDPPEPSSQLPSTSTLTSISIIKNWASQSYHDWTLFLSSPIFPSSLSISLLYFTTLSFDGTMISWLKTNTYSDALISGMRGIAVCTGLVGTAIMPVLERKIGLARAGSWSIWSETVSLIPVLISFHLSSPQGKQSPVWNQTLLFGGLALSRVGLWSFDLCQLKQLQQTLADHPRGNAMNGMQFALVNVMDLMRYGMVVGFSRPSQFKYTATLSFGAVLSGACAYMVYLRRERGHVFHVEWVGRVRDKWM